MKVLSCLGGHLEYVLLTCFTFLWLKFSVGEATAGKASRSLAQHIPGPGSIEGMKGAAGGVMGELTRARIALDERGQRLGELEEKTAGMMTSAEAFSKHAHEVNCPRKCRRLHNAATRNIRVLKKEA